MKYQFQIRFGSEFYDAINFKQNYALTKINEPTKTNDNNTIC